MSCTYVELKCKRDMASSFLLQDRYDKDELRESQFVFFGLCEAQITSLSQKRRENQFSFAREMWQRQIAWSTIPVFWFVWSTNHDSFAKETRFCKRANRRALAQYYTHTPIHTHTLFLTHTHRSSDAKARISRQSSDILRVMSNNLSVRIATARGGSGAIWGGTLRFQNYGLVFRVSLLVGSLGSHCYCSRRWWW